MTTYLDLAQLVERGTEEGAPVVEIGDQAITCLSAFETARSQAALYRLRSGQRIPAHTHSAIDDVFLGVKGTGRIRIWDSVGQTQDHQIAPGTLVVVTPDTPHEVSCAGDEFWYVLLQAPKELYDLAGYEAPQS